MHLKPEIRILGIDDSPLISDSILVIGAIMRGGDWLEGVTRTYITRDGLDATERLAEMVMQSKHYAQVRIVMLNGVTMGGFNVVDTDELFRRTGIPVITIMRKLPDMDGIRRALVNLSEPEYRYSLILKSGKPIEVPMARGAPVYMQPIGIDEVAALQIVQDSATHSRIPEPVRVAHLIATGVVLGESSRRV
jgi:hypothetical protein